VKSGFFSGLYKRLELRVNTSRKGLISQLLFNPTLGESKPFDRAELRLRVLTHPEIFGRVMRVIDDIVNGYEIQGDNEELKERVERFLVSNSFLELLESMLFDRFISGDGYLEPVSVKQKDAEKLAEGIYKGLVERGFLSKSFDVTAKARGVSRSSELARLYEPKELWWTDQRWIYKKVDKHGRITGYVQRVMGAHVTAEWLPGELINYSGFKIGNEVYGFTPLSVAFKDMETFEMLKKHVANFFYNNGVPDYLINVKNAAPGSPQVKALELQWKERRDKQTRGSLLTTGDVEIKELTNMRDMDFPKLIHYMGFALDVLWGIPPQAYSLESSSTRSIDTFFAPYYTKIRKEQKKLEDVLNSQLFSLFGAEAGSVSIKFKNPYLRDAVRNSSWVTIAWRDGRLSPEEYREHMGLVERDPESISKNPHFGEASLFSAENPFRGVGADNNVNGDKDEREDPKETVKRLGLEEGVHYN
jgi:hypothetical protein